MRRLTILSGLALLLAGCSPKQMAVDLVGDSLAEGGSVWQSDDDPISSARRCRSASRPLTASSRSRPAMSICCGPQLRAMRAMPTSWAKRPMPWKQRT